MFRFTTQIHFDYQIWTEVIMIIFLQILFFDLFRILCGPATIYTHTYSIWCSIVKRNFSKPQKHTQLCQQFVDGLDDVCFECSKVLPEVFLTESSGGQQLVERLLLVCFLAAASRSAEWRGAKELTGRATMQCEDMENTVYVFIET